jgi:hypothetical protein
MFTTLIAAPRDRRQQTAILAAIALLHFFVFWLLWREIPVTLRRAARPALEIVNLAAEKPDAVPGSVSAAAPVPRANRNRATPTAQASAGTAAPPMPVIPAAPVAPVAPAVPAARPPATTPTAPGAAEAPTAPPAPIDWFAERERVASETAKAAAAPPPRGFGIPPVPREYAPPQSDFGWSHARTHRVEPIEGGGIAINLSDQCVLVLMPLPFVGCALGRRPANGDLLRHMHHPAHPGDWKDSSALQVP